MHVNTLGRGWAHVKDTNILQIIALRIAHLMILCFPPWAEDRTIVILLIAGP
jgi:hypothetical protein